MYEFLLVSALILVALFGVINFLAFILFVLGFGDKAIAYRKNIRRFKL